MAPSWAKAEVCGSTASPKSAARTLFIAYYPFANYQPIHHPGSAYRSRFLRLIKSYLRVLRRQRPSVIGCIVHSLDGFYRGVEGSSCGCLTICQLQDSGTVWCVARTAGRRFNCSSSAIRLLLAPPPRLRWRLAFRDQAVGTKRIDLI